MDATAMREIQTDDLENQSERLIRIPWQRNGESGIAFKVSFIGNLARVENFAKTQGRRSVPDSATETSMP
jgi:hypothetical protein